MVGYDVPKGYVFLAIAPELPPNGRDFHVVIELAISTARLTAVANIGFPVE